MVSRPRRAGEGRGRDVDSSGCSAGSPPPAPPSPALRQPRGVGGGRPLARPPPSRPPAPQPAPCSRALPARGGRLPSSCEGAGRTQCRGGTRGGWLTGGAPAPPPRAGIEDLREKREEINKQISSDEQEKTKIQNDLAILTKRLSQLNDKLAREVASRNEYDKTIQETEAAYLKILESSQTLLTVLKRESVNMTKKRQASS